MTVATVLPGCGGTEDHGYSDAALDTWLGICMEGSAFEAFCRCEAAAAALVVDEDLFLEHIRSPLFLLPDAAMDEQHRRCHHLDPVLRADGVAGVDFGTALAPALDRLAEIFGDAEVVEDPGCGGHVAAWEGLRLTFSSDGGLVGWAYGAFRPGDRRDPLGIHGELLGKSGSTWRIHLGNVPWSSYGDLVTEPGFVTDDPPTLLLVGPNGAPAMRAITAASDRSSPIIRLEAGTVCSSER